MPAWFLILRRLAAGALLALVASSLAGCPQSAAPSFRATDVTGAEFGRAFQLTDHRGRPASLEDFRGKAVVVFFGFTHCPDVCPTTLSELAGALRMLGDDAARVQVVLITVDPARDTPEVLAGYVTAFNPSFLGLTGTPAQIAAVAKEFKVIYQKVESRTPDSYSMDHSAGTFIFDPQGRLRLYVGYGQGADVFAHDLALLLEKS